MTSQPAVYLIHFDEPIGDLDNPRGQAQHYLGSAADLEERLHHHSTGNGSRIMAVISEQGVGWTLAQVWRTETEHDARQLEKTFKKRHNSRKLCPICRKEHE